jgi:hypothetical protein
MARAALGLSVRKLAVAARVARKQSCALNAARNCANEPLLAFVKYSKPPVWSSQTGASLEFD